MPDVWAIILNIMFELLFFLCGVLLIHGFSVLLFARAHIITLKRVQAAVIALSVISLLSQIPFFIYVFHDIEDFTFSMLSCFTMVLAFIISSDFIMAKDKKHIYISFRKYKRGGLEARPVTNKKYLFYTLEIKVPENEKTYIFKTLPHVWDKIKDEFKMLG